MKRIKLLALAASLPCLAGAASAQVVTVSIANSWTLLQESGAVASSDFKFLTGSGNDFLNINSFSTGGRSDHGPAGYNQTQSNVQGIRNGSMALSDSTSAQTLSFAVYSWGGPGQGTVTATASCAASGVLGQLSNIKMSASAATTFTLGIFGTSIAASTTSSAVVTAPQILGGGLGAVNRLILSQGAPLSGTVQFAPNSAFYYSSFGDTSANATLKKGDAAFLNVDVLASATISLF